MKIIENFESTNKIDFEKLKEFDEQKTKVFKYITYKKRTEQEIRKKFSTTIPSSGTVSDFEAKCPVTIPSFTVIYSVILN